MADTHPSEYLIHKYWARKPSNIIGDYLENNFKRGDLVIDPFCGSGVFLAEARKRNIDAIGYDINPIAYLLSEVTSNPPPLEAFLSESTKLLRLVESFKHLYEIDGKQIRYAVHMVESKCGNCKKIGSIDQANKVGSKYHCLKCNERLSFNFEKSVGTKIVKILSKDNEEYSSLKYIKQQEAILAQIPQPKEDQNLITNRRILSFPGMKLSDLFTPRAFYVLSNLFEAAHETKDQSVRNALLLLLTSSVAQSSRLIPSRNNLSTGGPAWTIPGFWIAPLHLETNPIIHLKARQKKFVAGLSSLTYAYKTSSSKVDLHNESAYDGLSKIKNNSVDGFFFDPPYGDNVPYVEFSAIWNGFLRKEVSYEKEIIVSDRKEYISSWDKYEKDIIEIVSLFNKKLKKDGKIIMTFNNLDPRAWKIVLDSFTKEGLVCTDAKYQIPAVVSSKSQTAANTSYVGDYYCIFEKLTDGKRSSARLYDLTLAAKKVLVSRGGRAPKNLVHRAIILEILNGGMDTDFLDRFDEIITPIASRGSEHYELRDTLIDSEKTPRIEDVVVTTAENCLKDGKRSFKDLYETILDKTSDVGSPSANEVRTMLNGVVFFDKNYAYLQRMGRTATLFT